MANPKFNSKSPTIRRILREAAELSNSPSPDYTATPLESDLFEWHFTFRGPPNSSYSEGIYHGRIVLPATYPLRPPSFRFLTPSGRFETNREICLSISGHHEETWQPAWGVRTALVACVVPLPEAISNLPTNYLYNRLRSFMETDPRGQLGGLETSDAVRRRHATVSHSFKCPTCAKTNIEIIKECEESAKAIVGSSNSTAEVEIPSELKMGWKDEMAEPSKSDSPPVSKPPRLDDSDGESAELAEGFVCTARETTATNNNQPAVPQPPSAAAGRPPVQMAPTPTRTVSQPMAPNVRQVHQRPHDEGVPLWVDRAIVAIVVLLLAMILKVVLEM
ncbi:ubiquitin-conjugating enzyme [Colletotrichum sojae]|uniref:Ubiquitin-conjugating enzyme n=1 Tax=Colletotrichum sojae TaxID=2175907 RepID=A0A8H6JMG5_9PEZI|nr:ubiquitin-conjugating enzyme [Colletotrichum sojae]